ncbi:MAG: LPS-assembly protein LptD [Thermodesulfobacteriota bacterium]
MTDKTRPLGIMASRNTGNKGIGRRTWWLALAVLGLSLPATACLARDYTDEPWEISADRISRYTQPEVVVAEGNVVLRRVDDKSPDPVVIKADWMRYNLADNEVVARGSLSMHTARQDVTGQEAVIDLKRETATLVDSTLFVPENNLHFSGSEVLKTDAVTYRFKDGDFTTCKVREGKTLPWRMHSAEATVTLEKVVTLKHTVLRVRDIPVLYVPYFVFPANTKRKSGFLLPEISQSTLSGTGLITPFFVDLSPSSDITVYPGYLSERGMVGGVEFRYAASDTSRGTLAATYVYDRTVDTPGDDYKSDDYLRSAHNRYWVRGKLDHDFGDNLWARADLDFASDRDYLQELGGFANGFDETNSDFLRNYHRGLEEETKGYRTSQFQLTKSWSSSFVGGQAVAIDDLAGRDDLPGQVNTLPRLLYSGITELERIPLSLGWQTGYDHYWREDGIGEQRVDLYPSLLASLPLGPFVEGTVRSGVRGTLYSIDGHGRAADAWTADSEQMRTAWDFNATLGTTLERDFAVKIGSLSAIGHSVRPEIGYSYLALDREDELPAIDEIDLLEPGNGITYGINNYFRLSGERDGDFYNRYAGYVKILQSYDIREARRDPVGHDGQRRPFSDLRLLLNAYPLPRWQTRYTTTMSVYGEGVTGYDLYTEYATERGNALALDYRYAKGTEINQINAALQARLSDSVYLQGDFKQSLRTNEIVSASVGLVYHPQCWAVKFLAEKSADDERVALMFSLVGLGQTLGIGVSGDLVEKGIELDTGTGGLDLNE